MARRKKSVAETEDEIKALRMFPDLPTSDDDVEVKEDDDDKDNINETIAELRKQIEDQKREIDESRRSQLAIMSQPLKTVAPQPPKVVGELPNPIDDPDGYAKAIRDQIEGEYRYKTEVQQYQQQQQQQEGNRLSQLWEGFQEAYPDYADNQRRVEIAAAEVVTRARNAGTDLNRYMYGNSSMFMKDVAKEIDNLFGKPAGNDDVNDEDDDGEDNRTGGISGGHTARSSKRPSSEKLGSLTADIMDWQNKTGYKA